MARLKKAGDYHSNLFLNLHRNNVVNAGIVFFIVVVAIIFLTNDKTPTVRASAEVQEVSVIDYKREDANPLQRNQRAEIEQVVKKYYQKAAKESSYAEEYGNIAVYTKEGPYENSYLAFVSYEMKIKGIYTAVPGLGTLYIEKDQEKDKYRVADGIKDKKVKGFVKAAAGHADVQALMSEVQARYESALQSDSTLQEAMSELQAAYKDDAPEVSSGKE